MDSPVEQVRAGVDVVELISGYVQLKKAGRTHKALCPFHTEKTPSFVVFPATGRWHCFGCGEGGDVFTFLMKVENLTFAEALRRLADRIGVPIVASRENEERREVNKRLYAANEAAAVYYHGVLLSSPPARQYVASRGIIEDSVQRFLLGLAPDAYEAMQRHLLGQGFSREELLATGLLYAPEDGPPRDRYRGRLMFPIRDAEGRIVSFGGRALGADMQPKYLNGPQTDIFDKGSTLFGLYSAAQAIRKEERAVVVEGYVDAVVAHQAGFHNVVATLGTAITERHLRQLARLAPEICLALDPDQAGETAVLRGAEVARDALSDTAVPVPTYRGLIRYAAGSRASLTVALLPEGKDPDELILADPEAWRATIASARPVVEHAIDALARQHDLTSARGKAEAAEALAPLLRDVADPIQRAHYVEAAAQRLRIDSLALAERVGQGRRARGAARPVAGGVGSAASLGVSGRAGEGQGPRLPTPDPRARAQGQRAGAEHYALALLVAAVQRGLPQPDLAAADFPNPSTRGLLLHLADLLNAASRSEWRPDVLSTVGEPWLQEPVERVREFLPDVRRLTDAQLSAASHAMLRQLRDSRLAVELQEHSMALEEADPEDRERIKAKIAENSRERATLQRAEGTDAPGLGHRLAVIPARFRQSSGE